MARAIALVAVGLNLACHKEGQSQGRDRSGKQ